jgi:hypothetical protein
MAAGGPRQGGRVEAPVRGTAEDPAQAIHQGPQLGRGPTPFRVGDEDELVLSPNPGLDGAQLTRPDRGTGDKDRQERQTEAGDGGITSRRRC